MIRRQSVAQQFIRNMRVNFRRTHAGVAEHLLDGEQVGTAFEQMRGKTMPKRVRTNGFGDAISLRQVLDNQEDHLSGQSCATAVEKDGVGEFGLHVDVQPCAFDVLEQDFQAVVADRHKALLAAFANDAQKAVFSVDIADLQSNEFRNTEAAAVHHLNQGLVAVAVGLAQVDAVNHLLDFLVSQHFGEMTTLRG